MVSKETVIEALKECYDPEIPVNIVDLGLIYDVRVNSSKIEIDMTLTAPGCPMSAVISGGVKERLLELDGISDVLVNMVWEPAWTPDKMSEDARKALGY